MFWTAAVDYLWQKGDGYLMKLLRVVKADFLLFVFDERKEVLALLNKGRCEDTYADVAVPQHDAHKVHSLLRKCADLPKGYAYVKTRVQSRQKCVGRGPAPQRVRPSGVAPAH